MADEDNWKKIREKRVREDEIDSTIRLPDKPFQKPTTEKLKEGTLLPLIDRAEKLIEQINGLYQQYFSGVEKRPPAEARRQLDALLQQVSLAPRITQMERFRYGTFQAHVSSFLDKWERAMKLHDAKTRKN